MLGINNNKDRGDRKIGYIREVAADFVSRNSNRTSLITVTRTEMSLDGKGAKIFISVLPENKEEEALDFLKRQRSEFRKYLGEKIRMYPLPYIDFLIDAGEKNRQRLEEISGK